MIDALHPYPVQWIDRWTLRNGKSVTVRPVLPQDYQLESDFVASGLTQRSRYQRFQIGMRELPDSIARYFTHIDYHDHFALIVESFDVTGHVQVGDARFVRDAEDPGLAEFGIAVADAWQGLGIGQRLFQATIAAAQESGIAQLYGDVLRDNAGMLALALSNGFTTQRHPDDALLVRVRRMLAPMQPATAPRTPRPAAAAA